MSGEETLRELKGEVSELKKRVAKVETAVELVLKETTVLNENFKEHKDDDKEAFKAIGNTMREFGTSQTEIKTTIKVTAALIVFALSAALAIHKLIG